MPRGDWVPCRDYGVPSGASGAEPANIVLVAHGDFPVAQTAPTAVPEVTDQIVVERVVGQIDVFTSGSPAGLWCARIRVALYDDNTDSLAVYADDLFSDIEANEPFLWQRYGGVSEIRLMDPVVPPEWSMLDVRVSRKLSREQALILTVQTSASDVIVTPFLRSWARFV